MVLELKSPSIHNQLGNVVITSSSKKIPHPASTRFDENESAEVDFPTSSAKRRKLEETSIFNGNDVQITSAEEVKNLFDSTSQSTKYSRKSRARDEVADIEQDSDYRDERGDKQTTSQLETALSPVQTDEEAIEAYEAYRAAEAKEGKANLHTRFDNKTWTRGKSSIYVDAFNLALETVLQQEGHLFNEAERAVFSCWEASSYEAQYLYVRLFLRKTSAWFRIGRLGYYSDIGDMDTAVVELQKEHELPHIEEEAREFPGESVLPEEALPLGHSFKFAECSNDHIHTLDEASNLLLLDELKVIAKDAKVQGKTKKELLQNLRRTSGKQTGLGFKRSDTEETSTSNFADDDVSIAESEDDSGSGFRTPTATGNRDAHYTKKILEQTGKCTRLSLLPLKLFERVHLVFYRSTEWTDKSLTTLVLAGISRRTFPKYVVSRSANIFESRSLLLEFEASLRTQFKVDNYLEFSNLPVQKQIEAVYDIFQAVYPRWKVLLSNEQEKEDKVYETGEGAYLRRFSPGWVYTRIVHKGLWPLARMKEHKHEHEILTELLDQHLFHAARRGAWYQRKALLEEHYMFALTNSSGRSEDANKKHWKRIALKTCEQGLEDNECHVIYHYDLQKRVMKLEKQLRVPKREQHDFGHVGLNKARERDVEGIQIVRSEREDTPSRTSSLRTSRKDSTSVAAAADSPNKSDAKASSSSKAVPPAPAPFRRNSSQGAARGFSTKTTWLDELDTNEHVSVEAMCLSHYRRVLGYKGYHSEGGILRTLFGLLFYDILFEVYVPNVFQTAFQTCPLDLHTDAFYSARISEINVRINELAEPGHAERLIRAVWAREAHAKTCVVGVRWDEYELEDLCEIVTCFEGCDGGGALGVVMRVMVQEYAARGDGVPDLFLWKVDADIDDGDDMGCGDDDDDDDDDSRNANGEVAKAEQSESEQRRKRRSGKVMFAEVKSENDRLSDTQRLWISVLLNAGIEVELCHAIARETRSG